MVIWTRGILSCLLLVALVAAFPRSVIEKRPPLIKSPDLPETVPITPIDAEARIIAEDKNTDILSSLWPELSSPPSEPISDPGESSPGAMGARERLQYVYHDIIDQFTQPFNRTSTRRTKWIPFETATDLLSIGLMATQKFPNVDSVVAERVLGDVVRVINITIENPSFYPIVRVSLNALADIVQAHRIHFSLRELRAIKSRAIAMGANESTLTNEAIVASMFEFVRKNNGNNKYLVILEDIDSITQNSTSLMPKLIDYMLSNRSALNNSLVVFMQSEPELYVGFTIDKLFPVAPAPATPDDSENSPANILGKLFDFSNGPPPGFPPMPPGMPPFGDPSYTFHVLDGNPQMNPQPQAPPQTGAPNPAVNSRVWKKIAEEQLKKLHGAAGFNQNSSASMVGIGGPITRKALRILMPPEMQEMMNNPETRDLIGQAVVNAVSAGKTVATIEVAGKQYSIDMRVSDTPPIGHTFPNIPPPRSGYGVEVTSSRPQHSQEAPLPSQNTRNIEKSHRQSNEAQSSHSDQIDEDVLQEILSLCLPPKLEADFIAYMHNDTGKLAHIVEVPFHEPSDQKVRLEWQSLVEFYTSDKIAFINLMQLKSELEEISHITVRDETWRSIEGFLKSRMFSREDLKGLLFQAYRLQLLKSLQKKYGDVLGDSMLKTNSSSASESDTDNKHELQSWALQLAAKEFIKSHRLGQTGDSTTLNTLTDTDARKNWLASTITDKYEKSLLGSVVFADDIRVTYDAIGGLEEVKETLRESVSYPLKYHHLYDQGIAAEAVKGVLLFGPPGTGKTMLAKAVATEGGASFLSIDASAIQSKWVGETEKLAKAAFDLARKLAPCVIFIDEADSLLSSREQSSEQSGSRVMTSMKTTLMQEWDGMRSRRDRIIVIAATNRPFELDEAVLRRLPRRILVDLPDLRSRTEILQVSLAENRVDRDLNLTHVASLLEGYSGSDIRELCREAVVRISHERARMLDRGDIGVDAGVLSPSSTLRPVSLVDFKAAMKRIRPSITRGGEEMRRVMEWNEKFGEFRRSNSRNSLFTNKYI